MADSTIIDDGPEEEVEEAPKGGGLVKLLLLLVPFTLLPASAGAYVAYTQYPSLAHAAAVVGWDVSAPEPPEEESEEAEQFGHFASLNDLLINPAGTSGGSFLLVNLGLESKTPEVLPELEEKDIVIRDIVLKTLSEHTVAELSNIELREGIKEELRTAINERLDKGAVDRLYFTQYVLQ